MIRVGIGLPSTIAGVNGHTIVDWARRSEERKFTSLAVIDRYIYDSYEPFVTLAGAAAVTSQVRLATTIVVGPLRNTALLAKSAASVDALSNGRLVLGLAVGAREDDYRAANVDYHRRGKILNDQLASLRSLWEKGTIGPRLVRPRGPDILVGGLSDQAFSRTARYADGYVHGGGPPKAFARAADRARAAWRDAGRPGLPQIWAQGYFALGPEGADKGTAYLKDYYAFTGPFAEKIAAGLLSTTQSVVQYLRGYQDAGCTELVLFPAVPEVDQVERLAEAVASL